MLHKTRWFPKKLFSNLRHGNKQATQSSEKCDSWFSSISADFLSKVKFFLSSVGMICSEMQKGRCVLLSHVFKDAFREVEIPGFYSICN